MRAVLKSKYSTHYHALAAEGPDAAHGSIGRLYIDSGFMNHELHIYTNFGKLRAMESSRIKPQDILILMKLLVLPEKSQQKDLAESLGLSRAEVSYGLRRLKSAGLLGSQGPSRENAIEFLVHALKYMCPPEFGQQSLGMRTSFAHPDFNFVKFDKVDAPVWPYAKGKDRGVSLLPIYKSLPEAAISDSKLYELASLVEMIRSGRARERALAIDALKKFLKGAKK
jgi:hypothetical protein